MKLRFCELVFYIRLRVVKSEKFLSWKRDYYIPFIVCFSIGVPRQNEGTRLTPVSDTVFYALSHGSLRFVLKGGFKKPFFKRI